jgi:hypothetical protein
MPRRKKTRAALLFWHPDQFTRTLTKLATAGSDHGGGQAGNQSKDPTAALATALARAHGVILRIIAEKAP